MRPALRILLAKNKLFCNHLLNASNLSREKPARKATLIVRKTMESYSLRHIGAVCAIIGALFTGVSNGMQPELAEPAAIVKNAASSGWIVVHWGLISGMVLMQLGYLACVTTLRASGSESARDCGTLSIHMLTLGLALWLSVFSAEASLSPLAGMAKTERVGDGPLALAGFVDAAGTAATFVYWLGIALLGGAMLLSRRYPFWIGASGAALGASISLGVGLLKAFAGASAWTERYGFQTLAILFLLWTLALGLLLWREPFRYAQPQIGE
jgi:hypothetical protein